MSFNNALRSALREDPDAILVGELRDLETIRLALTAAETGHLVFGTLHTSSAAKTSTVSSTCFRRKKKKWYVRCCPNRCKRSFHKPC
jgi:twitching motility protein PilT